MMSATNTKTVLVSIGGINRSVTFATESEDSKEKNNLFEGIKSVFEDMLSNNPIAKPAFLTKNEDWRNEFVDIGDQPIPDRAVVRVVDAVSAFMCAVLHVYLNYP